MSRASLPTQRAKERILVCGVLLPEQEPEADGPLSELRGLLEAAGAEPVGDGIVQSRRSPDPATFMGRGKVEEVAEEAARLGVDAVAIDNDLSPGHIRNLEKRLAVRVLDRSEVILDIFACRAKSRQARLQVELAQTEYLLPRLRRMWTHLERSEGAIGTRGPGETQLETDRRLLRNRVRDLRQELKAIEERRQREVRSRREQFTVGLVGYTNTGKSTLLNRLTGSRELAADMLFATLDTRTRQWHLPDGRVVLLSDTVGFLQRLPHHLVASFHATLEETLHADLLLHVVDVSHRDALSQLHAVRAVLAKLSWNSHADLVVFNKIDRELDPLALDPLLDECRDQEVVRVSARTGEGLDRLTAAVVRRLDEHAKVIDVFVPLADGRSAAAVRRAGALLEQELIGETHLRFRLKLSPGSLGVLYRDIQEGVRVEDVEG